MKTALILTVGLCAISSGLSAQTALSELKALATQKGGEEPKIQVPSASSQDAKGKELVEPPIIFTREQISAWINEERTKSGSEMEFELMETKDWSNYVNFQHFVSLTYEGVPEGYRFDYNWPKDLDKETRIKTVRLPSAEVTESGKFMMWWNRCNFYEQTEEECKIYLHLVIAHEGRHFIQWQAIAVEAITKIVGEKPARAPMTIEDFAQLAGVKDEFMLKWADGPHYQCREVEVYTAQIITGEMPEDIVKLRLSGLANYYKGCNASRWKGDFQAHLDNAVAIFVKHEFKDY